MKKRGQVSIFIILAVVLVISLILFFIFNKNDFSIGKTQKVAPEIQPIQLYVQNCVEEIGDDAIYYIGQHGGYYKFNEPYLKTYKNESFPYYLYDEKNMMPTKEKIESELSNYVNENLASCTGNFEDFNEFSIQAGNINTKTNIESDKVIFDINYPLSIRKGENSYEIKNFDDNKIYVRLGVIYDGVSEYMVNQDQNVEDICITCLYDIANKSDLYVDLLDYDNNTEIFVFIDENSKINNMDNYTFKFANRYE